jgi:copper transport protein
MLVEALVLGGQDRLLERSGDFIDLHQRAAFLADVPPLGIFDPALWRFGLSLDAGIARLASIPGFILLAFAWHFGASRALGLAGTALLILSLVGSSHASAPSPRWFGAGALALHLAAILFWFGAFVPLIGALTRKGGGASAEILRFAKLMIPALIVILVTGAALLFVQVGAIDALLASDYATPLGLKLVAIVIVLAFAARNKWIHTPLLHREPAHGAWALTRSIRFEAAVALGALAFATLLAFTAPPRVLIAAAPSSALHLDLAHAEGRTLIVAGGDAVAAVTLEPARIGANRLSIALSDADDLPLPGAVVSVVFALADGDRRVGPVALRELGGGDYEFSDLDLPRAGLWRVTLTVDRPETNATTLETEVTLK